MVLIEAKDYNDMSRKAANIISAQVIMKPHAVLGLATGSTPVGAYKQLVEWYNKGDLDFANVTSVNLDEYKGLSPENDQSYRYFMNTNLFNHVNINKERTFVPNGLEPDSEKACAAYNEIIRSVGGIVHFTLRLIKSRIVTVEFTLHIIERRRSIIKLNLPCLRSAVIFTEGLGGIGKSLSERFDFLFLCLDFLIQHLVSCRECFYGTVVFVELRLYDLHFRAENLEGLIDFGQCLLEFFFALKTDF